MKNTAPVSKNTPVLDTEGNIGTLPASEIRTALRSNAEVIGTLHLNGQALCVKVNKRDMLEQMKNMTGSVPAWWNEGTLYVG